MNHHYRHSARECLHRAVTLLDTNDDEKLPYACLELRKCIEGLSYDLFRAYLKELPLRAFETWQPDKVMKELLRIDPQADKGSTIKMQTKGEGGDPEGSWFDMGEEHRLHVDRVTKMYHQLGSFLHVPTIKQSKRSNPADASVTRERATAIKDDLALVLSSKIWNVNFANSVTFSCSQCETPIKRRVSILTPEEPVECGQCGQGFGVEAKADGSFGFVTLSYSWNCKVCGEFREVPRSKAKDGLDVSCPKCKDVAKLSLVHRWTLTRAANKQEAT